LTLNVAVNTVQRDCAACDRHVNMYTETIVNHNQKYRRYRPFADVCIYLRSYDLDLDVMTLILDLDLNVLEMYLCTKNEVCRSMHSKARELRQDTDSQTQATSHITTLHSRVPN